MDRYICGQHPWAAMVYMCVILLFIMITPYDVPMVLLFVLLSINMICTFGLLQYARALKMYVLMTAALAVFNVLFNPRGNTPFLYINDRPFTVEALFYGIYMGCMVSSLMLWFRLFQTVFDSSKITYLIGSRLPVIGLILSMVFTYYEKFILKIDKIHEVWNTYDTEGQYSPVKKAGIILSVLLSVMLEDSVDTALSMCARGYGTGKRTSYQRYTAGIMDGILLAASAAMVVLYIWKASFVYAGLVFFMLLPVGYQVVKELQWKHYLSKI